MSNLEVVPLAVGRSAGAPAVEVSALRKEFRRRDRKAGRFARRRVPALDDVTFTIARGECVAVLGQNGSGKSTLVRLLSTLLLADGGTARVFGHDVFTEPKPVQRLSRRRSSRRCRRPRISATRRGSTG